MGRVQRRDPTQITYVGQFLEDGARLVQVLEVDHSGAIVEDCCTENLIEIEPVALMQVWRPVRT